MDMQQGRGPVRPREVEVKLELDAAGALALEEMLGPPQRIEQHAVYFDTPDRRLFGAHLVLRVRASDGRLMQTVKTVSPGAGLFDRGEWEKAVTTFRPVADDRVAGGVLVGETIEALVPIFEIDTVRACWPDWPRAGAARGLDRGRK
ncbi:MAG: CYTH domain-containing protein [Sphingomonas sp.]